jgi:hypothetical protein
LRCTLRNRVMNGCARNTKRSPRDWLNGKVNPSK